jgi:hypothetical protein
MTQITPAALSLMVSAGGIVAAKAAVTSLSSAAGGNGSIPLTALVGQNNQIGNYASSEGFYFDDGTTNIGVTNNNNAARLNDLKTRYGLADNGKICLIFNGNSAMGSLEKTQWLTLTNNNGLSVDVSASATVDNLSMNVESAFVQAAALNAKAIILSADPYFTHIMHDIVKLSKDAQFSNMTMSYPLQDYADEARKSNVPLRSFMARGPALAHNQFNSAGLPVGVLNTNAVYYQLGKLAGKRLTTPLAGANPFAFSAITNWVFYTGL